MKPQPMMQGPEPAPKVIGWREWVTLPQWGIRRIKAKIDTGARTSAIHVDNITEVGAGRVRFDVVVCPQTQGQPGRYVTVEADVVRISRVRPSTGKRQHRLVVTTTVQVGSIKREVELSLVSRHGMRCRMLLGRRALEGLLVDPNTPLRLTKPVASNRAHGGATT